jgi:hypothetical protein
MAEDSASFIKSLIILADVNKPRNILTVSSKKCAPLCLLNTSKIFRKKFNIS